MTFAAMVVQLQEHTMPDNTSSSGGQDRQRIDVSQDYELRDWSKKFGVSPEALREAVEAVGDRADAVEEYLRAHNSQAH